MNLAVTYENGEILIETLYSFQENESKAGEPISGELVRRNELKNAEKWMAAGL